MTSNDQTFARQGFREYNGTHRYSQEAIIQLKDIKKILAQVKLGEVSVAQATKQLKLLPYQELGFAKVDSHREIRKGFPEVIFGEGKTVEQILLISKELASSSGRFLITRVSKETYETIKQSLPKLLYNAVARSAYLLHEEKKRLPASTIPIVTAGTADLPVAEEAAVTAEVMANRVERIYDVGVAGLHRVLAYLPTLEKARVIIVVAGMDGALPSVIGGLVSPPVIAVPTSTGYGASFQGLSALLTMLNTCSPGIAVVNIDNGFGAGYMASLINHITPQQN